MRINPGTITVPSDIAARGRSEARAIIEGALALLCEGKALSFQAVALARDERRRRQQSLSLDPVTRSLVEGLLDDGEEEDDDDEETGELERLERLGHAFRAVGVQIAEQESEP